ncbi:temptin-like [Aplysia californica]|uniref:Temptin-like n=1 Tax=Aplysia californica TaxID=6500 RepID=A0ABM0JMH5_APLCA|nr:temptin-like [Aplysia californica]
MLRFLSLLCAVALCAAHSYYISEIPNGDKLPNPCGTGTWPGVGHWNLNGGGPQNPFGEAFAAAGHKWTVSLCQADSDNDGFSNGKEVGDLSCKWTKDKPVPLSAPIGQPGICEPVNSTKCSKQSFSCP